MSHHIKQTLYLYPKRCIRTVMYSWELSLIKNHCLPRTQTHFQLTCEQANKCSGFEWEGENRHFNERFNQAFIAKADISRTGNLSSEQFAEGRKHLRGSDVAGLYSVTGLANRQQPRCGSTSGRRRTEASRLVVTWIRVRRRIPYLLLASKAQVIIKFIGAFVI